MRTADAVIVGGGGTGRSVGSSRRLYAPEIGGGKLREVSE